MSVFLSLRGLGYFLFKFLFFFPFGFKIRSIETRKYITFWFGRLGLDWSSDFVVDGIFFGRARVRLQSTNMKKWIELIGILGRRERITKK